jgi:threonylcarbamoyladenosine tRNA methylthiotransferase MtaB
VAEVLAEIDRVRAAGFREIALTGVHLGSYGRDLPARSSLFDLLKTIERDTADGIRLRISSLEPMDCSDDIVELAASSECFAPHFHLPLQHATNRLLVAMRRPYTIEYYRRLVGRLRERIPHASIGSDIIVGFPGETEADFAELEAFLLDCPLTHVHVFPYSDRPGTVATELPGKVHGAVVRDRAARVRAVGRELIRRFHESQDGAVRSGLTIEDGSLVVTDNYLKLRIDPGRSRNEWIQVRVNVVGDQLRGVAVN